MSNQWGPVIGGRALEDMSEPSAPTPSSTNAPLSTSSEWSASIGMPSAVPESAVSIPSEPPPNKAEDVAKSAASGIGRGVVGLPGIPGSMAQLYDIAGPNLNYWGNRARGMSAEEAQKVYEAAMAKVRAGQTPEERAGTHGRIFGVHFPTSERMIEYAAPYAPGITYEPKTGLGRIAQIAGEFIGGIPAGGIVAPGRSINLGRELITQGLGGVGTGVVGEAYRGEPQEGVARFVAGLAAPMAAGRVVQAVRPPNPEELIGQAARASGTTTSGFTLEQARDLAEKGHDVSLLDVRNIRPMAQTAIGRQPEAPSAYRIQENLTERYQTASPVFREAIDRSMGRPIDVPAAQAAAKTEAQLATLYPQVYSLPAAQAVWNQELQQVIQHPAALKAARKAAENVTRENGTRFEFPFIKTDSGVWTLKPGAEAPNLQFWDYTKRFLQDEGNSLGMAGRNTEANSINSLTKRLIDPLTNEKTGISEYRDLLNRGSRYFGRMDAFEAGQDFIPLVDPTSKMRDPKKIDAMINAFDSYTPIEKEAFQTSVAHSIKENPAFMAKIFQKSDPVFESRMRHILGDEQFTSIQNSTNAYHAANTLQFLKEGRSRDYSPWQSGMAAGLASSLFPIAQGMPLKAAAIAGGASLATHLSHVIKDKNALRLLDILESSDPNTINKVIEAANQSPEMSRALQTVSRGITSLYNAEALHGRDIRERGQPRSLNGTTEAELPPTIVTAPRIGRASGGRLTRGKHAAKAAALIRAAEQAKKQHNGSTKTILEQPDEVVAKALSVANSAI